MLKKFTHLVVTTGTILSLLSATCETRATEHVKAVLIAESGLIPIDDARQNPLLKDAVTEYERTGNTEIVLNKLAVPTCSWQIVVTIVVIGGVVYLGYKIYKACEKLNERINRPVDEDDDGNTNTNRLTGQFTLSPDVQMYCATFSIAAGPATQEDSSDCGCTPPIVFRYYTGASQVSMQASVPTRTVDSLVYRSQHGLSTNEVAPGASYSYNGQPTNYLSEIEFDGYTIRVNLPGMTNTVTHTIQASSDMVNWTNLMTISVPVGAQIKGGVNSTGVKFFRLTQ